MNGCHGVEAGGGDGPSPAPLVLPETDSMSLSQESCSKEHCVPDNTNGQYEPISTDQRDECLEGEAVEPKERLTEEEPIIEEQDGFDEVAFDLKPETTPSQEETLLPTGDLFDTCEEKQNIPAYPEDEEKEEEEEAVNNEQDDQGTCEPTMTSFESGELRDDQVPPSESDQISCEGESVEPYQIVVEENLPHETELSESEECKVELQDTCITESLEGSNIVEEIERTSSTQEVLPHDYHLPSSSFENLQAAEFSPLDPYALLEGSEGDIPVNTTTQPSSNNLVSACQNDASMSTTIGVSEIMVDTAVHDFSPERGMELPSMEDITYEQESLHSDAPCYTDGQSPVDEQRFSYGGGSSYHDDVPIEEDEYMEERATGKEQKDVKLSEFQPATPLYYATETPLESQLLTNPCTAHVGGDDTRLVTISSVSHAEPVHRAVVTPIEDLTASEDVMTVHADHQETPIPSFKDIVEDLERKK